MTGIVNWRLLEKVSGWANRMQDESEPASWDATAEDWNKRIAFEQEFTARQAAALDLLPTDTVLDACCGPGRLTIPLARRVRQVTALDAGKNMLRFCAENAAKAGVTNVQTLHVANWHKVTPGVDFPQHDVVVACISPAQADIVKLSRAATRFCYSLSFSQPYAYRHVMYELFNGVTAEWQNGQERLASMELGHPDLGQRVLGLNVAFNILFDLGANPTVNYVDGGWEYEAATREEVYRYLATLGNILPGKEQQFRLNADQRIVELESGRYRFSALTQMYVLGWDPNQLDWEKINKGQA